MSYYQPTPNFWKPVKKKKRRKPRLNLLESRNYRKMRKLMDELIERGIINNKLEILTNGTAEPREYY